MAFTDNEFKNTVKSIGDFLHLVDTDAVGLPGFQRHFVWGDGDKRKLFASVLCGEPIGSVLIQQAGPNASQFAPRSLEGRPDLKSLNVDLILDGQQRLTTIYHGFGKHGSVVRNGKKMMYLLNLARLFEEYPKPIVLSEQDPNPLSEYFELAEPNFDSPAEQAKKGVLNLRTLNDTTSTGNWITSFAQGSAAVECLNSEHKECAREECLIESAKDLFTRYGIRGLASVFTNYRIPWQELSSDLPIQVVENYFVRVNTGGRPLRTLELLSARLFDRGGVQYSLEEKVADAESTALHLEALGVRMTSEKGLSRLAELPISLICLKLQSGNSVLGSGKSVDGIGRTALLSIPREAVWGAKVGGSELSLESATKALNEAARFLSEHCGVTAPRLLPQQSMLLPLASHFLLRKPEDQLPVSHLRLWYYTVCLLQHFHGNTQAHVLNHDRLLATLAKNRDFKSAIGFSRSGMLDEIKKLDFTKKLQDQHKISGLGVLAMIVQSGALDWQRDSSPKSVSERFLGGENVELHHMVPESKIKDLFGLKNGGQTTQWIAVMTPISRSRNRDLDDDSPDVVFRKELGKQAQRDAILRSHQMSGLAVQKWREADASQTSFLAFIHSRAGLLTKFALSRYGDLWDEVDKS